MTTQPSENRTDESTKPSRRFRPRLSLLIFLFLTVILTVAFLGNRPKVPGYASHFHNTRQVRATSGAFPGEDLSERYAEIVFEGNFQEVAKEFRTRASHYSYKEIPSTDMPLAEFYAPGGESITIMMIDSLEGDSRLSRSSRYVCVFYTRPSTWFEEKLDLVAGKLDHKP